MAAMGTRALLAVAVMAVAVFGAASAATYNVGDTSGWTIGPNYATWASSKKFQTGDQIVFKYTPPQHDVLEVSKADYDSCSTSNAIATSTTGSDAFALTSASTRYFICGISGHCGSGMKVKIDVASSGSSSPSSPGIPSPVPAVVPAAGGPSANTPPPPSASAATSVGAAAGLGFAVLLAGLMA